MIRLRVALAATAISLAVAVGGCDISAPLNATDAELATACRALKLVEYDYLYMDSLAPRGRTLAVAASIHRANPGPKQTQAYCNELLAE